MFENYISICLIYTILFGILSSLLPLGFKKFIYIKLSHTILLGCSSIFALLSGISTLISSTSNSFTLPLPYAHLAWSIYLDPLAAFFVTIIGIITSCVVFYIPSYLRKHEHSTHSLSQLAFFTGLFVCGMYLVVLSHNALTFIAAWEIMSLASYFLVMYQSQNPENRHAGFIYLVMAHLSGLLVLIAFGILAKFSHSLDFSAMQTTTLPAFWAAVAFTFALIGFGMKAGLVPLHVWLPRAHPVAPSHISALMSGVMLKVAVYGFIRFTFDLLHYLTWQAGIVVLIVGVISALLGVLYALTQHNLKRLLAYHSVENIGIIFMGLGLAMIFYSAQQKTLAVIGLLAALYHCLNHAIFKSLLFLGAGAIAQRTHEHDLEQMGGLIHRMPFTALTFLIGCLSISALPPFNGFVSEWLTFQASLQATALTSDILRALIPITAALLALTSALAAACFVKVFGIAFLGKPRSRHAKRAHCTKIDMHIAMGSLAALCIILGVVPSGIILLLNSVTTTILGVSTKQIASHWLWITPASSSSYGSIPTIIVGCGIGMAGYLVIKLFSRRGKSIPVPRWDCGFGNLTSRMQYSATAFAMPIRRVFSNIWEIHEDCENHTYKLTIIDRIWKYVYEPLDRGMFMVTRRLTKIQGGNIRKYLAWMFFTLLFLLWVIS